MERVPIPNFEDYEITKEGLVTKDNVPMKMHIYSGRTPCVRLRNEDGFHSISVSKLVLLTFVGEPEYPSDIPAYKDGNNHNYHLSNLEWATRSKAYAKLYKKNAENRTHSYKNENECVISKIELIDRLGLLVDYYYIVKDELDKVTLRPDVFCDIID